MTFTEPQYGEPCLDCRRREATASDGLCDECADLSATAEAAAEPAPLSLGDELDARELAALEG